MSPTFTTSPFDFNMTPSALSLPDNLSDNKLTSGEISGITLPIVIMIIMAIYYRFCRRRKIEPTLPVRKVIEAAVNGIEMQSNPMHRRQNKKIQLTSLKSLRKPLPLPSATSSLPKSNRSVNERISFSPVKVKRTKPVLGTAVGGNSKRRYKLNIKRQHKKTRKQRGGTDKEDLLNILNLMISFIVPSFLAGNPISLRELNRIIDSLFNQLGI
jgi:hypothetical protein